MEMDSYTGHRLHDPFLYWDVLFLAICGCRSFKSKRRDWYRQMASSAAKRSPQLYFCHGGHYAETDADLFLFFSLQISFPDYRIAGLCLPQ